MCGIVGAIADRDVVNILMDGLRRLEYRGYDSAGVAVRDSANLIRRHRAQGKVKELASLLKEHPLQGNQGIAHTRWATHGEPSDINAHPFFSNSGNIAIIHNGILENYLSVWERSLEKVF